MPRSIYRGRTAVDDLRKVASADNHESEVERIYNEAGNRKGTDNHGRTILHGAAIVGNRELVKSLLKAQDVETRTTDWLGKPAVYYAMLREDQDMLQAFLNTSPRKRGGAELRDTCGRSTLHNAVEAGSAAMVELCSTPELISLPDHSGRTPLHYAARDGKIGIAKHILEKGADIKSRDGKGQTPLHSAARCGCPETMMLLIEEGVDITATDSDGHTALHVAAVNGWHAAAMVLLKDDRLKHEHTRKAMLLIRNGSDIDAIDVEGKTLLHWAMERRDADVVDAILEHLRENDGTSMTMEDKNGDMPLDHLGQWHPHSAKEKLVINEILRYLMAKGRDTMTMQDRAGSTPLHYVAKSADLAIIRTMLQHFKANHDNGTAMTMRDSRGCTPLHCAVMRGRVATVRLLLEYLEATGTTTIDMEDDCMETPLDMAVGLSPSKSAEMVQEILQHFRHFKTTGAECMRRQGRFGRTPLNYAVQRQHTDTVRLMLEHLEGARVTAVDVCDLRQKTPLHCAAGDNDKIVVEMILEHLERTRGNACLEMRDAKGKTPMHCAKDPEVKELLQRAMAAAKDGSGRRKGSGAYKSQHDRIPREAYRFA